MCDIIKRAIRKLKVLFNYKRNQARFCKLLPIENCDARNYVIRGADANDLEQLKIIYRQLNNSDLSAFYIKLLKRHARKLILVAEISKESKNSIIGMDMFYFNPRDFKEFTIHEGFIGIVPEFEGKGIATAIRKHAIEHFRRSGISGISTRISKSNVGSLRSAQKLGFEPIEEYYDPVMKEDRYYLICHFESNRD